MPANHPLKDLSAISFKNLQYVFTFYSPEDLSASPFLKDNTSEAHLPISLTSSALKQSPQKERSPAPTWAVALEDSLWTTDPPAAT